MRIDPAEVRRVVLDQPRKVAMDRATRIAWAVIDCAYYFENEVDPDIEAIFAAYGLAITDLTP